jgi:hypothetical protein
MQLGYRTRDEIALFVLNAVDVQQSFQTLSGEAVDPLDLASDDEGSSSACGRQRFNASDSGGLD